MKISPPAGSRISITASDLGESVIVIPVAQEWTRYLGGVFVLFWLGGWAFGEVTVASQILSGKASSFHIFWLGAWTLGGVYAAYFAYRSLRPTVPESLRLMRNGIDFDSGIRPPQFGRRYNTMNAWDNLRRAFPKRIRCQIDLRQLQSLRLRETDSGNRLTVDVDSQRIDIAKDATEVEREWLARVLAGRYSLPQVLGEKRTPTAVE